jgi:hypothetical protein
VSKSPKDFLVVERANLKIAGTAECDGTGMAKSFPKALCALYRVGGICTSDWLASDDVATDVIERHDHKQGDLAHKFAPSLTPVGRTPPSFLGAYSRATRWLASSVAVASMQATLHRMERIGPRSTMF